MSRPAFPTTPEFQRVLETAILTSASGPDTILVWPKGLARDEASREFVVPELRIFCPNTEPVTFPAFVRKLSEELGRRGHPAHQDVALAVLALILTVEPGSSRLSTLNRWLDGAVAVNLSQFFVLPTPASAAEPTRVEKFRVGELDLDRLQRWSHEDKADFFLRYAERLRGKWTIERGPFPAVFLPMPDFLSEALGRPHTARATYKLIDHYFHVTSYHYFRDFWEQLYDVQAPIIALGAPYLDESLLQLVEGQQSVSYLRNIGTRGVGWVCPIGASPTLNLVGVAGPMATALDQLSTEFNFSDSTPRIKLDRSVSAFVRFVAKGHRHYAEGRDAEAFLHFVIALDLLLGSSERGIGKTVAQRVALLVHRRRGTQFEAEEKLAKALYDARSKYVHEGMAVANKHVAAARTLAVDVLMAAFDARRDKGADYDICKWTSSIDLLVATLNTGEAGSPALWMAVGATRQPIAPTGAKHV